MTNLNELAIQDKPMKARIKPSKGCCNVGLSLDSLWDIVDGNVVVIDGDCIMIYKLQRGNSIEFIAENRIELIEDY